MAKNKYHQRTDGLFETSRTVNGKRIYFRGKTCREVDKKILAWQDERERGRKFPVIADEWETEHEETIRESTRSCYSYAVKRLKAAFPGYASEIEPLDVQRFIRSLESCGKSASSVKTDLAVCRMIFAHAVIKGDIRVNPAVEVKKSRGLPKKQRRALTEAEERAVKDSAATKPPFWLFPYLLLYTGLRRGEALALTYADIDRRAETVRVNKKLNYTGRNRPVLENFLKSENGAREIPLMPQLAAALPKNRVGLVFPDEDGGYLLLSRLNKLWGQYREAVGLPEEITPHCFRHSFVTICFEAGLTPRETASFAGDTVEVVEAVYTHLRQEKAESAAEKLRKYHA